VEILIDWLPRLVSAAVLTIVLAAVIATLGGIFGLALALALFGRESPASRRAVETYSGIFRSLPELVVLFFFYFGAIQIGVDIGPVGSTIIAFTLVASAFDYQVFKGALAAIPFGQVEAGRALGLRYHVIYGRIILPQMLPLAKKGWITYAIGTVKRISIASAISVSEILYVTKQGIAVTNAPFLFLGTAVVLYILMVSPLLVLNERSSGRVPA
jgi:His/Glu/Gln/Arg/opine family amino acid ABC transporter permease subunit